MTKQQMQDLEALPLQRWQEYINRSSLPSSANTPRALRIENTIYSTARFFGGAVINGQEYKLFWPRDPDGRAVPILGRKDFMESVAADLKERKSQKKAASAQQPTLFPHDPAAGKDGK